MRLSVAQILTNSGCLTQALHRAHLFTNLLGDSQLKNNQKQTLLRAYSPLSRPTTSNKSEFKIIPCVIILAIGSGSYVLLVKSRMPKNVQSK
jgi:hypothetical protein